MIIFLDFDGVLNHRQMDFDSEEVKSQGISFLDKTCVERLEILVRATDAQIVISSTWRILNTKEYIASRLGKFLGSRLHDNWCTKKLDSIRGLEVREWIDRNTTNPYKFKDYIILDDDKDFLWDQPLVWVDNKYGLQDKHVLNGIAMSKSPSIIELPKELTDDDVTNFKEILQDRGLITLNRVNEVSEAIFDAYSCLVRKYE